MSDLLNLEKSLSEIIEFKKGNDDNFRVTSVIPKNIDVASIRNNLHLSQNEFANKYGFSVATIRNWEQGRRMPDGAARTLLLLIEHNPNMVNNFLDSFSQKSAQS